MWVAIGAGISMVLGFVFSLAKASSRAEKAAYRHREELMARKQIESKDEKEKA